MSKLLLNPSAAVSFLPFEIPASNPQQFEPKTDNFENYLNKAQKTVYENFGAGRKDSAYQENAPKKMESSYEMSASRESMARDGKFKATEEPGTAKTEERADSQTENSSKDAVSKEISKDVKSSTQDNKDVKDEMQVNKDVKGQTQENKDVQDEKTLQKIMEDDLKKQTSENALAAVLAQLLQLLGIQNNTGLSPDAESGINAVTQNGVTSLQQVIDLLKSAMAQNTGKQTDITSEDSAANPAANLQKELDALVSMLGGGNSEAAQTIQSIIASQGKVNMVANQVGLNIITGQIEKLVSAEVGPDKAKDQKEILAAIARLIGDEKLSAQIMKDTTLTIKPVADTASLTASNQSIVKDESVPVSILQSGDLKPLNQLNAQNQGVDASVQQNVFEESVMQASSKDGGAKPVNLPILQTQLLKSKPDNTMLNTPPALISPSLHMPNQAVEVGTNSVRVGSEELFTQIIEQTKVMVGNGKNEIEINLKPEALGKIHLKIAMENQIVTAKFVAESQQVKEIIETNLSQLRSHLQENGIQVDALMVSVGNFSQGQSFEQMAQNQSGFNHSRNFTGLQDDFTESSDSFAVENQPLSDAVIDLIA